MNKINISAIGLAIIANIKATSLEHPDRI